MMNCPDSSYTAQFLFVLIICHVFLMLKQKCSWYILTWWPYLSYGLWCERKGIPHHYGSVKGVSITLHSECHMKIHIYTELFFWFSKIIFWKQFFSTINKKRLPVRVKVWSMALMIMSHFISASIIQQQQKILRKKQRNRTKWHTMTYQQNLK